MKKIIIYSSIPFLLLLGSCTINVQEEVTHIAKNDSIEQDMGNNNLNGKLQICPDEMIDNQMPGVIFDDKSLQEQNNIKTQYYILNGQRREIDEFDEIWVQENCNVETQVVY